jgi:hypothetical protein
MSYESTVYRILSNVVVELKIEASVDEELVIGSIGTNDEYSFYHSLETYGLQKESHSIIRKLLKNDIIKTSPSIWEYSTQPFNLIPEKITAIDNLLFLFPKNSIKVTFKIRLFSDNLLQPIENLCSINFKVNKKQFNEAEIEDAVNNMEDFDFPF